jgi:NAD(P)-dependent dehydrogenase (short-subunit alcohol dehydrogenase family)
MKPQTILITGAGSGIGKAVALDLAQRGDNLILLSKNEDKLNALYDEILQTTGQKAVIVPYDLEVLTADDACNLALMIEQEFGKLDGLLHNAGILGKKKPILSFDESDFNKVMNINVKAAIILTKALFPLLEKSTHANIIFTSSSVGRRAKAFWSSYAISKFATECIMQLLSAECDYLPNIKINSFNPQATRTNMRAIAYPGENPASVKEPSVLLPYYRHLLSDKNIFTGKALELTDFEF